MVVNRKNEGRIKIGGILDLPVNIFLNIGWKDAEKLNFQSELRLIILNEATFSLIICSIISKVSISDFPST